MFGNGKTSAKFNFGRYLEAAQNGGFFITNNPTNRLSTTSARTWTDNDRDYVVDCDLLSQAAQSPTTTGSIDACGVGNANFGTLVVASTLDPTLQSGWGVCTGDWQWGAALQHEVMPRVSAELELSAPLADQLLGHRQSQRRRNRLHVLRTQRPDGFATA